MRKIFVLLCLINCGIVSAQIAEQVTLKNGSVLSGYIYSQTPGKELIFKSVRSEIVIQSPGTYSVETYEINVLDLSDAWKGWVKENPQMVSKVDDYSYITLHDISVVGENEELSSSIMELGDIVCLKQVRILERGQALRCLDLNEACYRIPMNEVEMISRMPRSEEMLSGMVDVIETMEGDVYEGQILQQIPGVEIHLLNGQGVIDVISLDKVRSQKRKTLNPGQNMFAQSQFLDVIVKEDESELSGIVIEQNFFANPRFLVLQDKAGNRHKEITSKLVSIGKIINTDYAPIVDVILGDNEYLVNGQQASEAVVMEQESYSDGESSILQVQKGAKGVTLTFDEIEGRITLAFKEREHNDFVLVTLSAKKINERKKVGFTYEELVKAIQPSACSLSPNKTVELKFDVHAPGNYLLYNQRENIGLYVYVKN